MHSLGGATWQWDTEAAPEVAGGKEENGCPEDEGWPIADEDDQDGREGVDGVGEARDGGATEL